MSWHRLAAAMALAAAHPLHAANGCLEADFQDRTGLAELSITNDQPGNPFLYRPRCARVSAGTRIRFIATPDFGMHPLFAGSVVAGVATFDPDSPIGSATNGTEHIVQLNAAGEFPYYCDFHFNQGMQGSLLVVPQLFADGFED